jgi:hypothetical protein
MQAAVAIIDLDQGAPWRWVTCASTRNDDAQGRFFKGRNQADLNILALRRVGFDRRDAN